MVDEYTALQADLKVNKARVTALESTVTDVKQDNLTLMQDNKGLQVGVYMCVGVFTRVCMCGECEGVGVCACAGQFDTYAG